MAKMVKVTMVISTGYSNAEHISEYEMDIEGMSEKEIEKILAEEEERFVWEEIDVHSTVKELKEGNNARENHINRS